MLLLQQLEQSFGKTPVLRIHEARLPEGAVWLRGPNGAGKTTLLRILAGLSSCRGSVLFDGTDLRRSPRAYRSLLGWSEAEPLYPEFVSGRELLRLVARARGCSSRSAEQLAEALGFNAFDQRTGSYSSGMLKKLSLLLAFCGDPRLLLLDEPFSTLDPEAAVALQQHIAGYVGKGTRLCLFSSHQDPVLLAGKGLHTITLQHGNLLTS